MIVIGTTGNILAGQTTLADYLREDYKFVHYSFKEVVREEAKLRGKDVSTREQLQLFEFLERQEAKKPVWAEQIVGRITGNEEEDFNYVVEGFGFPDQIETFRKSFGKNFHLVTLDASPKTRYARSGKEFDSLEHFARIEANERVGYKLNCGRDVADCMKRASRRIINDKDFASFYSRIESLVGDFGFSRDSERALFAK